jgi:hypothetical protein
MPVTKAASVGGELSWVKTGLLARTRVRDIKDLFDAQEDVLVETVQKLTVDGAKTYLERWKLYALAAVGKDDPTKGHDADAVHLSQTIGNRFRLDGDLCPEDGTVLHGAFTAEIDAMYRQGLIGEDDRCRSKLNAIALMRLVRRGVAATDQHGDVRPLVIATVNAPTAAQLIARDPHDLATLNAELMGAGPIPFTTLERLLCQGDIVRLVHDGKSMPLDVGRRQRLATAHQWRALITVSGGVCEYHGCRVPHTDCQIHHLDPWEPPTNGRTDIARLILNCDVHHRFFHEDGYTATRTTDGLVIRGADGAIVDPPLRDRPEGRPPDG